MTDTATRITALSAGIADVLRTYPEGVGSWLASKILTVPAGVGLEDWLAEAERRLAEAQPLPARRFFTREVLQQATDAGHRAALAGEPLTCNPHSAGDAPGLFTAWASGWEQGDIDRAEGTASPPSPLDEQPMPSPASDTDELRSQWTFKGVTYGFTFPVTEDWAREHLRDREGRDV